MSNPTTPGPGAPASRRAPSATGITINGQPIPWSFIQMLRVRFFGGDWDRTIDCLYKARNAAGDNAIIRYVKRGLLPDEHGNRYSLLPSKETNEGRRCDVQAWWQSIYRPARGEKRMASTKQALKALLQQLCE